MRRRVVLTYDWSGTPEANMLRFGVPLFDERQMAASLALLAGVVELP
ncbi:hypothetical protein [uncultured Nocardioides sp.]|nr:hypothetical protein [uncultured Nocardioides sp.]